MWHAHFKLEMLNPTSVQLAHTVLRARDTRHRLAWQRGSPVIILQETFREFISLKEPSHRKTSLIVQKTLIKNFTILHFKRFLKCAFGIWSECVLQILPAKLNESSGHNIHRKSPQYTPHNWKELPFFVLRVRPHLSVRIHAKVTSWLHADCCLNASNMQIRARLRERLFKPPRARWTHPKQGCCLLVETSKMTQTPCHDHREFGRTFGDIFA
jgi:hypothetical protein